MVLALGNPLRGDDGIGSALLERLRQHLSSDEIIFREGGLLGLDLILMAQEFDRVIILDAVEMGAPPGCWVRIPIEDLSPRQIEDEHFTSCHIYGLQDAIALARALELDLRSIVLYGIQIKGTDLCAPLSREVNAAMEAVYQALLRELLFCAPESIQDTPCVEE